MDKQQSLNYIQCGKFGLDVLNYVSRCTEKLINKLVQEKGITITDNTLERIYNFTETYARQLTDTIVSESLNDQDFTMSDKRKTNIYLP
jgi:hypothetical protein